MSESKKMGRPAVFTGSLEKAIVKVIKANGLTGARVLLESVGVQRKPGTAKTPLKISLPTLAKLAKRAGIELKRGRPKAA